MYGTFRRFWALLGGVASMLMYVQTDGQTHLKKSYKKKKQKLTLLRILGIWIEFQGGPDGFEQNKGKVLFPHLNLGRNEGFIKHTVTGFSIYLLIFKFQ